MANLLFLYYVNRGASEQKARAVYENLIDLADDEAIIGPLLFLRQREIVHFNRFKELYDYYKGKF